MNSPSSVLLPKISVLIPAFNRQAYIGDCIQSALEQTCRDIEIIVVDNASTDNTWSICQEYSRKDPRVRIFRNEHNLGAVRNWLRCITEARGVYGKILWSDDLVAPTFLEKTVPLLENDDDCAFVYTATKIFSDNGEPITEAYGKPQSTMSTAQFIEGALIGEGFPVSPGCALFRLEDLRKNLVTHVPNRGGVDITSKAAGNDLLIFLLTAKDYSRIRIVDEPLAMFRAHAGSITVSEGYSGLVGYYDIARAWFVSNYVTDRRLQHKLNSKIFLRTLKYRNTAARLSSVGDYYERSDADTNISIPYLLRLLVAKLR